MDGSSDFNTSHVTVYLRRTMDRQYSSCISIHLMLRFIARYAPLLLACGYFNTSHVTVYRRFFHNRSVLHKFQYISCYGLSQLATGQKYIENQFQYISCYGLSCFGLNNRKLSIMISIHLMLRFIKMSK